MGIVMWVGAHTSSRPMQFRARLINSVFVCMCVCVCERAYVCAHVHIRVRACMHAIVIHLHFSHLEGALSEQRGPCLSLVAC